MVKRSNKKRVSDKAKSGVIGAESGAVIGAIASGGNPVAIGVGALAGAAAGIYYGDTTVVFPEPMIIFPAREQYLLGANQPSYMIYAHAGEALVPTGGNVDDNLQGQAEVAELVVASSPRKKTNAYTRFNKRFKFRAKKKSESGVQYMKMRNKAVSKAWRNR